MELPGNEHPGWERLLAAVLAGDTAPQEADRPTAVEDAEDAAAPAVVELPDLEDLRC